MAAQQDPLATKEINLETKLQEPEEGKKKDEESKDDSSLDASLFGEGEDEEACQEDEDLPKAGTKRTFAQMGGNDREAETKRRN
mmetsp:Transcript_12589/g.9130  ORF Transcript_12589/g.9130 Transcript_12589/m.9130 type:complete len:84 (-) Transcript_12589:18-269(-)